MVLRRREPHGGGLDGPGVLQSGQFVRDGAREIGGHGDGIGEPLGESPRLVVGLAQLLQAENLGRQLFKAALDDQYIQNKRRLDYSLTERIDGYLFNMNKLFEDFLTVALREAYRDSDRSCRFQDPHHLDEAHEIRMKPDFVLYGPDGDPQAVADAKYKAEKPDGYPDADLYQMLAYCTALGLSEGHLVYAKGNAPHTTHRVRHAGIVIHQHALDLDQPPSGLLASVTALARLLVREAGA
ncbi:hypothetical protein [Streptomyces sp. LN499]|uniref:5-methylcytosine restriction system specificity protein McrC n=1 Tax=Streptomyces sp. LN499 TaxID=3112977 RepID=UPI00372051F8